jgi:hypothetical protein
VAEGVVDELEVVDVDHQQGAVDSVVGGQAHLALGGVLESAPVQQPGEVVVVGPVAQLALGLAAGGDVDRGDQATGSAVERQRPSLNLNVDDRAVAPAVTPVAALPGGSWKGEEMGLQRGDVLGRADVADGHAEELLPAVPVVRHRGVVDRQEGKRLGIEHPHRLRVVLEHHAVA